MSVVQFRCAHPSCRQYASFFRFQTGQKVASCPNHRVGSPNQWYDIAAHHFSDTPQAVQEYFERKAVVARGKRNLTELEAQCSQLLASYLQRLHSLPAAGPSWEEQTQQLESLHQQVMQGLQQCGNALESFEANKNIELGPEEAALCQTSPVLPPLITQFRTETEQALRQLTEEFGGRRLHRLREATLRADEHLSRGIAAREAGEYETAMECLQRAKELSRGLESAELSLQLGLTHLHYGARQEAEAEMRRGLYPAYDPASDSSVSLKNGLGELYFQGGQWEDAIVETSEVLQRWQGAPSSLLIRAVYFVLYSHNELWKRESGTQLNNQVIEWLGNLPQDSYLSLFVQAEQSMRQGKDQEAVRLYEEGLNMSAPVSCYCTLTAILRLAGLLEDYSPSRAMEWYRVVCAHSELHFPFSLVCAKALSRFALLTRQINPREAKNNYDKASTIYTNFYEKSYEHGLHYYIGSKIDPNNQQGLLVKAKIILQQKAPNSLAYARCLSRLGKWQFRNQQFHPARIVLSEAAEMYERFVTKPQYLAKCVKQLGLVCKDLQVFEQAKIYLRAAATIYWRIEPNLVQFAKCCEELRRMAVERGQNDDEEIDAVIPPELAAFHRQLG